MSLERMFRPYLLARRRRARRRLKGRERKERDLNRQQKTDEGVTAKPPWPRRSSTDVRGAIP